MRYLSPHNQQLFSIQMGDDGEEWTVRFAPYWRIFRRFRISSDDHVRQLFHLLNQYRACEDCQRVLVQGDRTVCEECRVMKLSNQAPTNLSECPVCYEPIMDILQNRVSLVCGHDLCKKCSDKVCTKSENYMWDPVHGMSQVFTVKCPMCRQVTNVNAGFIPLAYPDLFTYLGVS